MNQLVNGIITILAAVVGVAILAVLVSKSSNTTAVLQAGSSGFAQILGAAESPVTGASFNGSSGLGMGAQSYGGYGY